MTITHPSGRRALNLAIEVQLFVILALSAAQLVADQHAGPEEQDSSAPQELVPAQQAANADLQSLQLQPPDSSLPVPEGSEARPSHTLIPKIGKGFDQQAGPDPVIFPDTPAVANPQFPPQNAPQQLPGADPEIYPDEPQPVCGDDCPPDDDSE